MPKGDRKKPTAHPHSQSNDPTGISAKGLAPTGITSGSGITVVSAIAKYSVFHRKSVNFGWLITLRKLVVLYYCTVV